MSSDWRWQISFGLIGSIPIDPQIEKRLEVEQRYREEFFKINKEQRHPDEVVNETKQIEDKHE